MIKDNTKLLYFPKLVLIGETTKGRGYTNEKSKIYKLDWTDFNNRQKNNYISWSNNWLKDGYKFKGNYTTILDKKRMKLMTEQEFIIPLSYMKRIKHYAELAHKEWNESNPFDTNVRETCLDVAESSVYVSFYLLKDCIYGTDNFVDADIWLSMALSNFWMGQTGRGLVAEKAKLDRFENPHFNFNDKEKLKMKEWFNSFKNQYKKHNKMYERITLKEWQILNRDKKLKRIIND